MKISLQHISPIPLKERLGQRVSDVWNTTLVLDEAAWVKIKAPSGTGKTTLVHIIYGLREDYEGGVYLDNALLRSMGAEEIALVRQDRFSVVFQDLRLFPQLSCRENIELKRIMQKPVYEASAIASMAERLGVSHILDQRAGICSYGEQQRVAIIRALMQPFSWLIMDEPFSHLDASNTNKAAALIGEECKKRSAGLLVTDLDDDDHFAYTKQLNL